MIKLKYWLALIASVNHATGSHLEHDNNNNKIWYPIANKHPSPLNIE